MRSMISSAAIFVQQWYFPILLLIFVGGLFLRTYRFGLAPLRFDQVQILTNADQILSGDIKLIGPRTGPAEMFTGPLVYYLTAAIKFFVPSPYAVVIMATFLFACTYWVITFLLLYYNVSLSSGLIFLGLYAFSNFQVMLDRTPWNPNLMVLAGSLVFLPLLAITHRKKVWVSDALFVGLGVFFGYQGHFSGLFLPILVGLFSLVRYKKTWMLVLATLIGFGLTIAPTLIFDIKHNWLNTKGFLSLLTAQQKTGFDPLVLFTRFGEDAGVSIENMGKFVLPHAPLYEAVAVGAAVITIAALMSWFKKRHVALFFPLLWIGMINLFLFFYSGSKPEYYFMLQIPAVLWIYGSVIETLRLGKHSIVVLLFGFFMMSFFALTFELESHSGLTMKHQLQAEEFIRNEYARDPSLAVVYDIVDIERVGLQYLLSDLQLATISAKTIHTIFPHDPKTQPATQVFGTQAVWMDPRTDETKKYVLRKNVVISFPQRLELYEDIYPSQEFDTASSKYVIFSDAKLVGRLYAFDFEVMNARRKEFLQQFEEHWNEEDKSWQEAPYQQKMVYIQKRNDTVFILAVENKDSREMNDLFDIALAM